MAGSLLLMLLENKKKKEFDSSLVYKGRPYLYKTTKNKQKPPKPTNSRKQQSKLKNIRHIFALDWILLHLVKISFLPECTPLVTY
jgi:hypothetical protein